MRRLLTTGTSSKRAFRQSCADGDFTAIPLAERGELKTEKDRAGLCADCQHAKKIESARGSKFVLCELSATNPAFPKYPRLPVLKCAGYAPKP